MGILGRGAARAPLNTQDINDGIITAVKVAADVATQAELDGLVDSAPGALDTLNELAAALNDDASFSTTVTNSLTLKAPLASPTFTGNFTSVGIDDNADALAITIDSSEKVGIGETSPDAKLEVSIDSSSVYAGHFKNTAGTAPTLWVEATGNDANDTAVFKVDVNTATRFMVSNQDGNVGIGTTAPGYMLQLGERTASGTSTPTLAFEHKTGGDNAMWNFGLGNASKGGSNDSLYLEGDSGTKMVWVGNGNVGIGTKIPHSTLQLGSESQTVAGDGNLTLARSNGAGAAGKFRLGLDSSYSLSIGFFGYYGNDTYTPQLTVKQDGNIETSTKGKIKQKGAFMEHSVHQSWVLG